MFKEVINRTVYIAILVMSTWVNAAANNPAACRASEVNQAHFAANPQALIEAQNQELLIPALAQARAFAAAVEGESATVQNGAIEEGQQGITPNPTYIIPVVFHVYGTSFNGQTVNNAIVEDALFKTNEDFQGQAADWNEVISEFAGVKDTLSIEFRLAKIDPNGNSTTGIIYHANQSGFGNGSGYDSLIQADAWDNYKYMNVYIQNDLYADGTTNNSGVAWYPSTSMSNANLARVVYNGAYLGTNTSENFRSVLTHEFGHWLNLIHTFEGGCSQSNENNCSGTGDRICDTPQVDNSSLQGTNCLGQMTNWQNFMHYADQYANYTEDQVTRMINALNGSARNTLWTEQNLIDTGTSNGGSSSGGSSSGGSSSGGSSSGGSSSGGQLQNGVPVSGLSASTGNDVVYSINVPSGASNLVIKISGGSGDADLYTRAGAVPTDSTYACRPYAGGNNETCTEPSPTATTWYARVKAYETFSGVTLTASYTSGGSSSGGSSSGGSSSGGSSSGGSSSGGQLQNGVPVSGLSASTGNDVVYSINVPSGASNLVIKISGGSGDADLYTRAGAVPTDSTYACRPYAGGNNETCTEPNPTATTWYARVKAYETFSGVTLTASYNGGGSSSGGSSSGGSSSGGSSSGGSSSGGSSGGLPNACASEAPHSGNGLTNGDPICVPSGSSSTSIRYFWIYVPSGTSSIQISSGYGSGNGNLYYRSSSWATASSYDQSSTNSGNTESITVNNPSSGYRYVSVVGNQSGMTLLIELQ